MWGTYSCSKWGPWTTPNDDPKGKTIEDEVDDIVKEDIESPAWKEFINQIGGEVTNHPSGVDLETSKDVMYELLMKDLGLMPFNSHPDQVVSVVGDLELAIIPYIIIEDLSSHQSFKEHIIL